MQCVTSCAMEYDAALVECLRLHSKTKKATFNQVCAIVHPGLGVNRLGLGLFRAVGLMSSVALSPARPA